MYKRGEELVMSEKVNVPTFEVHVAFREHPLDGAVVAPNKKSYASDFPEIDEILQSHRALLVYDSKWHYIPLHQIQYVTKGKQRFLLPWPLV
ncbi:hypothetical protein TC41_1424 [Alicyclobacillus acidocaldarius subsp. acidocaldarius Tc-4-1]|uniref:Uncharacterized protein n=2 Tax=Alicyclobacillus acidocaldarius TaxID=405212 RepID=F8IIM8_ALIAT|nr:hypothetical protein TC41_1424 [Alicyclobacillus acidocaldarius subsp. acidocaldarius Tc-4-1]